MGNSTSNANNRPTALHNRRVDSQRSSSRPQSPPASTSSNLAPHRSLRTKKKSLELPDLASLALSPGSSYANSPNTSPIGQYRRPPRTSSPIPIPTSPANNNAPPRGRPQNNISTQYIPDVLIEQQPSTHIPVNPPRGNPFFRGAPIQYNSTRSFTSRGQQPRHRMQDLFSGRTPRPPAFVPETVHSTIPLALRKAQDPESPSPDTGEDGQQQMLRNKPSTEDPKEPVSVKITWRGGGKSVLLARAGDNNWKGRRELERDNPTSDAVWSTWVPLLPGTHHIKFIVDDQWRVADDIPTAVDDEGSLANYVAVPISGFTPPSASTSAAHTNANSPVSTPLHQPGHSFWSASSSVSGSGPGYTDDRGKHPPRWTTEFPPELIAAAREEEAYLASSSSASDSVSTLGVAAPNIPPAPVLPRHLDKLILNVKPSPGLSTASRVREREREERRGSGRKSRSQLGMTSTIPEDNRAVDAAGVIIPVTTASGTDVTSAAGNGSASGPSPTTSRAKLDGPGLADDASVLPVPSHVVLHHLSTSAIRNGVLAVGSTTRYKKKYLTTIYYKPT